MGKEIFERKTQTEEIPEQEKGKLIKKFSVSKSKFKRFETYLKGKIQVVRNMEDKIINKKTFEIFLQEIMVAYKKLFETTDIIIERIGFKRDGHSYDIYKGFDNDYRVWLYESESPTIIDKEKINFIFNNIINLETGKHYGAKYFFNKIIKHYGLTINDDEFSGGKNRALFYFPLYLAPIKIIERETDIIKVTIGRGGGLLKLK